MCTAMRPFSVLFGTKKGHIGLEGTNRVAVSVYWRSRNKLLQRSRQFTGKDNFGLFFAYFDLFSTTILIYAEREREQRSGLPKITRDP